MEVRRGEERVLWFRTLKVEDHVESLYCVEIILGYLMAIKGSEEDGISAGSKNLEQLDVLVAPGVFAPHIGDDGQVLREDIYIIGTAGTVLLDVGFGGSGVGLVFRQDELDVFDQIVRQVRDLVHLENAQNVLVASLSEL